MTVSLGGYPLSDNLVLQGIESAPGVAWSSRRTLGGRAVVQIGPGLTGGRELALLSEYHLSHADVQQIKAMENAGQAVVLVHHRGTFNVLITNTSELEPDTQFANPTTDTELWYSGAIRMIEV